MNRYNKILSEIQAHKKSIDIDTISYVGFYEEQPVADVIDFNWKVLLEQPANNSTQKTYDELITVVNLSKKRNREETQLVSRIDNNANSLLYAYLSEQKIKFPSDKFHIMYNICKPIVSNIKYYFNRARPYQIAKVYGMDINVLTSQTHHTPSYPSGHVFYTSLATNFIIQDYPKLKQKMNEIVNMTSKARMLQGVHYLSDNIAGQKLANILYNKLKKVIYD